MSTVTALPSIRTGSVIKWRREETGSWNIGRVIEVNATEIVTHGLATLGNDPFKLPLHEYESLKKQGLAGRATTEDISAHLTRALNRASRTYYQEKRRLQDQLKRETKLFKDAQKRIKSARRNFC